MARQPTPPAVAAAAHRKSPRVRSASPALDDLFLAPGALVAHAAREALFEAYVAHRAQRVVDMKAAGTSIARADRAWRASTQQMYRAIWQRFSMELAVDGRELQALDPALLQLYFEGRAALATRATHLPRPLDAAYQRRVLALIDMLVAFDAQRRGVPANTAVAQLIAQQPALQEARYRANAPAPARIPAAAYQRLKRMLMLRLGSAHPQAPRSWSQLRDYAIVCAQLAAGLTPGEVRTLPINAVQGAGNVDITFALPGNGNVQKHTAVLASWAAGVINAWLTERTRMLDGRASEWLFCRSDGRPLQKSALVLATRSVLATPHLELENDSAYQLRHTYVLERHKEGASFEAIAGVLGIHDCARWKPKYEQLARAEAIKPFSSA